MSDAGRRGMPLLSGRAPSPDPSVTEGACRKCNKEFNLLFSRSRKCNHCGYSYCHSCTDYQALMPRAGHDQAGYDPMHVCGFCIDFLTITAAGKAQLKAMPLGKLKKYVTAYNIKIDRAVEKDDLIDGIIAAKGPDGCLSRGNENFYRKYSVPNRATGSRSRGLFSRPNQSANSGSNSLPPRPTMSAHQEFARPDLAPDDPPLHSHSQPNGSSWRAPSGPPPPPPPHRPQQHQTQYTQAPPPPPRGSTYPGGSPHTYAQPPSHSQTQSHPYSQTGAGQGYPGASPNYYPNYNAGYNPRYAPYTPHGTYPPPPQPQPTPGNDHYYSGQSAPPPPPPRETRPPPPAPNHGTYPSQPSSQPPHQTNVPPPSTNQSTNSSAPRAPTASTAPPPPVPTLDELLDMTSDSIGALSISSLKSILFANHVGVGQILEKSDLVKKVLVLVEDEKRERARAREAEEFERISREAEREERERERRENDERVQMEREEHEREREEARESAGNATTTTQDDVPSGSPHPSGPPNPPSKTEEPAKSSVFTAAKSHAAAHLERTGLCVICQDEEANIAIVDCGHLAMCRGCSELVMSSSRECPLCRTRIVTEARLLRIFKT